jgi:hypothetical protein
MKVEQTGHDSSEYLLLVVLFLSGLLIFGILALFQGVPGYMDAEYYYLGGENLASGKGFWEMVIWNYLDDPAGLPNPSHAYWMPLPSLLAAAGLVVFGQGSFFSAQIPFILLAACIPLISFRIASLIYNSRKQALFAALLAFVPGYYAVYLTTTDTVSPYIVLGGFFLLTLLQISKTHTSDNKRILFYSLILGITAGLMHLTRSDGLFWLAGALISPFWLYSDQVRKKSGVSGSIRLPASLLAQSALIAAGYLLVMTPWFVRNFNLFGSLLAPGGFQTLWLVDYNQTFIYPAHELNFSNWFNSGFWNNMLVRVQAVFANLTTFFVIEGVIILVPFMLAGFVKLRKAPAVQLMGFIWLLTFFLMSIIFPFAGMRGGFLHASAGFQTLVWAVVPMGFDAFIRWGVKHRGWKGERSGLVFKVSLISILSILSLFIFFSKVQGGNPESRLWQAGWNHYAQLEAVIAADFPDKSQVIIVNNPPGYYLASGGRSAIVIPDGGEETLHAVVQRYKAEIIAIDRNIVGGLKHLYENPASNGWIEYLYTTGDTRIYRVRKASD